MAVCSYKKQANLLRLLYNLKSLKESSICVWHFQRENGWCEFSVPHVEVALENGKRAYYAVESVGEKTPLLNY